MILPLGEVSSNHYHDIDNHQDMSRFFPELFPSPNSHRHAMVNAECEEVHLLWVQSFLACCLQFPCKLCIGCICIISQRPSALSYAERDSLSPMDPYPCAAANKHQGPASCSATDTRWFLPKPLWWLKATPRGNVESVSNSKNRKGRKTTASLLSVWWGQRTNQCRKSREGQWDLVVKIFFHFSKRRFFWLRMKPVRFVVNKTLRFLPSSQTFLVPHMILTCWYTTRPVHTEVFTPGVSPSHQQQIVREGNLSLPYHSGQTSRPS